MCDRYTSEICTNDFIADEYHYLFTCNNVNIIKLRNQLIPKYYTLKPNLSIFAELLSSVSTNKAQARDLNNFIKEIF